MQFMAFFSMFVLMMIFDWGKTAPPIAVPLLTPDACISPNLCLL